MHGIEDHIFLLQDIYHENKLQKKSAQKLDGPREIFFLQAPKLPVIETISSKLAIVYIDLLTLIDLVMLYGEREERGNSIVHSAKM